MIIFAPVNVVLLIKINITVLTAWNNLEGLVEKFSQYLFSNMTLK